MESVLRVQHYRARTLEAYAACVRHFLVFHRGCEVYHLAAAERVS